MQPNAMNADATLDPTLFRQGMARLAASVTIVTTDGPAGRHGLTATAVCSVTDSPPTLLVCINRSASAHDALIRNRVLCVNVLSDRQQSLSSCSGGGRLPVDERFGAVGWSRLATGAPVLDDAVVSFDGRISHCVEIGTHTVIFCAVSAMTTHGGQPPVLLYADRAYGCIGPESPPPTQAAGA